MGGQVHKVFGASHTGADFHGRACCSVDRDIGHGFVYPAALCSGMAKEASICVALKDKFGWVGRTDGYGDGMYGFAGATVSSGDPADFGWIETTTSI